MSDSTARDVSQRGAIAASDFVAAEPAAVAPLLDDDSIHLWRLPYYRAHGRAPLRTLLAAYLGADTDSVVLREDEYGKPRLLDHKSADFVDDERNARIKNTEKTTPKQATHDRDSELLRFNWSHSRELALVALARGIEPGVDVERIQEQKRTLELAHRFFAPTEALVLTACPESEREAAFLRLWCAKEAVLKALGHGITFGLERVVFARNADGWRPAQFVAEAGEASAWQMHALSPAPGYLGALAWCGPPRKVQAWRPLASD